jgi:DNA ligase-1
VSTNTDGFGVVTTEFGQIDTDKPQVTIDIIKEGKNKGKKNETSAIQQAQLQAQQTFDKKIKSGYSASREHADSGADSLSGIKPMLAQVLEDRIEELQFPCIVQPKLDGMRLISVCHNGSIKLYSRTQKEITTLPHIIEQLAKLIPVLGSDWVLDGEAYNQDLKEDFNRLIGIIKRDEKHEDSKIIQYHIYDIPSYVASTSERLSYLAGVLHSEGINSDDISHLVHVPHTSVLSKQQIDDHLEKYLSEGYEGLMVRSEGPYENKRSKYLLKYKKFQDEEFTVVGVEEGKGNLMGHAGSFVCALPDGGTFNAKMTGERKNLKEMFENFESKYLGKSLTVKFFQYTPDMIPRFPVAIRFRFDKD